jgi:hypothetical protein
MRSVIRLLPLVGLLVLVAGVVLGLRRRAAADAALLAAPLADPFTGTAADPAVPPVV